MSAWGVIACDLLLNNERTNEILERGEQFDLLITENFHTDCAAGLAYQLNNIPVVGMSSCVLMPYYYQRFGLPDTPSYIPSEFVGFSEEMSLTERVVNFAVTKGMQLMFDILQTRPDNEILRKRFGKDFPDIRRIVKNQSLVLLNTHYAISGARPYTPNVIDVAGVHVIGVENKKLPENIQEILDESRNGAILMSFGSTCRLSSLPTEKRNMLMAVFSRLEQTVIMKWENDSEVVENKPANVHFFSWLPQREILAHSNLKLFISHGGMMGMQEALINEVPVLATPMFGDQYANVAVTNHRKAGFQLDFANWSEESLMKGIQTCLSKEYQANAKMLSFYIRQGNPLKEGTDAIERVVATNGLKLARTHSIELSWITYYSIDAIVILLYPIVLLTVILYKTMYNDGRVVKTKRE